LAGPAGLYFFADKIKEIILQLTVQTVMKITYPAFSKLQGDDIRLKEGFRSVILCTTFLVFPIMVFVSALAPLIFDVLLPEKWLGASIFLQLMCLASIMNPLNALNLNIMKVKGRADLVFYVGIYKKVVSILIFCFTLQFTIEIILFGQIVASVINYIPNAFFSSRLIDYKILEQISDVLPAFLLSFFVGLLVYVGQYIINFSGIFYLLFLMLFSIVVYVTVAYLFRLRSF
jgi:O-antigen/teichoic acid export membrane protein